MERVICNKCGLSEVVYYEVVGDDLWSAETHNCTKKRNKDEGLEYYICNECGEIIDTNDMMMIVNLD